MRPHIKTRRCVTCHAEKADAESLMNSFPDLVISRVEASALGSATYRTGEPCRRGHVGWRYISNGACIECMRGVVLQPAFELIDMSRVITIADQHSLFIGYAWDGRRMIGSNGERMTSFQFNIMVGGPGKYEATGGYVYKSHEAFMRNFVKSY